METNDKLKPFTQCVLSDCKESVRLLDLSKNLKIKSGYVVLHPGKDVGTHSTKGNEEIIIFLQGEGRVIAGEKFKGRVSAGSIAYNPPNTDHNVINTGSEDLKYIYVVAPVE